jgi:uncharacterized protein (UPF0332 family)
VQITSVPRAGGDEPVVPCGVGPAFSADLIEDAGRAAYLAAFHAAQVLVYARENRSFKTNGGVQSEFSKLIRDDPSAPTDLRRFVSRAYGFKTIADYDPLTSVPPTKEDARAARETTGRFVEEVVRPVGPPAAT